MFQDILLMTILVWTALAATTTASTLYDRGRLDNDLEEKESEPYYPIADEEIPSKVINATSSSLSSNLQNQNWSLMSKSQEYDKNMQAVINNINKHFDNSDHHHHDGESEREEQVLIKAIKLLFKTYGHKPSDMKNIFLPNSHLFSSSSDDDDDNNKREPGTKSQSGTAISPAGHNDNNAGDDDEYSLSKFRDKINGIIERNEGVKEELRGLLRVIREIEIDDFSESLKLIENLNQGFEGNQTLLIAVIQAAAQQWGEPDSVNLPPPFGNRNDSSPFNISDDLREELLGLSDLLTKDLRARLIQILAEHHNETEAEISHEIAIIEEDQNGNVSIEIQHSNEGPLGGKPKRDIFFSSSSISGNYTGNNNTQQRANLIVEKHEEEGDDDDFTITEELVLDKNDDDVAEDDDDDEFNNKFIKRESNEEAGGGGDAKISKERLENIIRQEHRRKREGEEQETSTKNYYYYYKDGQKKFIRRHRLDLSVPRASRTKRV